MPPILTSTALDYYENMIVCRITYEYSVLSHIKNAFYQLSVKDGDESRVKAQQ